VTSCWSKLFCYFHVLYKLIEWYQFLKLKVCSVQNKIDWLSLCNGHSICLNGKLTHLRDFLIVNIFKAWVIEVNSFCWFIDPGNGIFLSTVNLTKFAIFFGKKSPKFQCHTIKTKKKSLDITIIVPELSWQKLIFLTLWKLWKNGYYFLCQNLYKNGICKISTLRFEMQNLEFQELWDQVKLRHNNSQFHNKLRKFMLVIYIYILSAAKFQN
jgi:hypothetical protein